jgi:hypothetical protein
MAGLCCLAQKNGDLGKELVVTIHHKNGTTTQRCGVCEVVPSCKDQSKLVFAFRFLANAVCRLPGKSSGCTPTAAGRVQYNAERALAARGGASNPYEYQVGNGVLIPRAISGGALPYSLPLS